MFAETTAWHIYNPHGDTSAITMGDASFYSSYRYDAFGNVINGAGFLNYDYAGKWQRERDHLTGDVRMGVREYDPVQGRFEAVDPVKGWKTNPQSRNRYEYALNNPLVYQDLDGMMPDLIGGAKSIASDIGNGWSIALNDHSSLARALNEDANTLSDMYWDGYYQMPTWAQYTDTAVILGGLTVLSVLSDGLASPVEAGYARGLLSRGAKCMNRAERAGNTDRLSRASSVPSQDGRLSTAGRALQKHGSREGSSFPAPKGSPSMINAEAQQIVDDILSNPKSITIMRHHARFGDVIEVREPSGRGLRFDANGNFIGLLEANK